MLKDYLNDHNNVNFRLLHTDEPGVSNARNIALDNAKGDFITFIDDDDFVSDYYLEELLKVSDINTIGLPRSYDFVDGDTAEIPSSKNKLYQRLSPLGQCHYSKARKYFSGPVMKLIHKSIIGNRRFNTKLKNGEDSVYMFLLSDRFTNVQFAKGDCVYYRRLRRNSAISNSGIFYTIHNLFYKIYCYTCIYMSSPRHYAFGFYATRVLGSFKNIFKKN